jgi:hypothetical protein
MRAKPLNEFTRAELEAAQQAELGKREKKPCRWCHQEVKMLKHQMYCSSTCRASYHNFAKEAARERLIEHYEGYIKDLLEEVAQLKAAILARDTSE